MSDVKIESHPVQQIKNTLYKLSHDVLCSDSQVFRDTFASGVPGEIGNHQMDRSSDQIVQGWISTTLQSGTTSQHSEACTLL
jgi:hypothetical protein